MEKSGTLRKHVPPPPRPTVPVVELGPDAAEGEAAAVLLEGAEAEEDRGGSAGSPTNFDPDTLVAEPSAAITTWTV